MSPRLEDGSDMVRWSSEVSTELSTCKLIQGGIFLITYLPSQIYIWIGFTTDLCGIRTYFK